MVVKLNKWLSKDRCHTHSLECLPILYLKNLSGALLRLSSYSDMILAKQLSNYQNPSFTLAIKLVDVNIQIIGETQMNSLVPNIYIN